MRRLRQTKDIETEGKYKDAFKSPIQSNTQKPKHKIQIQRGIPRQRQNTKPKHKRQRQIQNTQAKTKAKCR